MSEKVTVSVIIPVYNAEKYIVRCLESVIGQTYADMEILVINDGSSDRSEEIIQEYGKKDSRISYFFQENRGVSAARNQGLRHAKGKYVLFVDSDDYVSERYVEDFVKILEYSHADLAVCGYFECYEKQGREIPKSYFMLKDGKREYEQKMLHNPIDNYFGVLWNKCFRTEKVREWDLSFAEGRSFAEDYAFLMDYLRRARKLAFVERCNYFYLFDRENSLGKGSTIRNRRVEDLAFVYRKYKEYWEHLEIYRKKKKRIQFYAMKLYFEEMKFYSDATKEEKRYLEKKLLFENGLNLFDVILFKGLRVVKHFTEKIRRERNMRLKIIVCSGFMALLAFLGMVKNHGNSATVIQNQANGAGSWNLVWSEEFDGNSLNPKVWTYDIGKDNWGNEELEYYTDGLNAEVTDGNLVITARKESFGGAEYTSARIKTQNKLSVQYGRIEGRIKLPSGQGIWPAFWMMGVNDYWPRCGEIDIMEAINECTTHFGTVHWGVQTGTEGKYQRQFVGGNTRLVNPSDWHIYALEWDDTSLKWFLDGNCFYEFTYDTQMDGQHVFANPFYMILNVAVGGNWAGDPDDAIFPQSMYVDYIRVYSK